MQSQLALVRDNTGARFTGEEIDVFVAPALFPPPQNVPQVVLPPLAEPFSVKLVLPANGAYRRVELTLDRSPVSGRLRCVVDCFEALNPDPVRIEFCLLHKFGQILRERYGVKGGDLVRMLMKSDAPVSWHAEAAADLLGETVAPQAEVIDLVRSAA